MLARIVSACHTRGMRTAALLLIGAVIGAATVVLAAETAGGYYRYITLSRYECEMMPPRTAEVVPNQPNPCNFRVRRWQLWP